jgi:hypothetical protein
MSIASSAQIALARPLADSQNLPRIEGQNMQLDIFIAALGSTAAPLGSSAALAQDKAAATSAALFSMGSNAIMVPRTDGPSPGPATLFASPRLKTTRA